MADRASKKPPPDDPNKAAKAVVDRVAALTEDDPDPSMSTSQDNGSARSHNSDKVSESDPS